MRTGIYGKSLYLPFNFVANLKLLKKLSLKKFLKMKSKKNNIMLEERILSQENLYCMFSIYMKFQQFCS